MLYNMSRGYMTECLQSMWISRHYVNTWDFFTSMQPTVRTAYTEGLWRANLEYP
jgi:hypothetical protein